MTMENAPFEDVFLIEHVDFPMSCQFSQFKHPKACGKFLNPPYLEG